jgi:hypothetical protein
MGWKRDRGEERKKEGEGERAGRQGEKEREGWAGAQSESHGASLHTLGFRSTLTPEVAEGFDSHPSRTSRTHWSETCNNRFPPPQQGTLLLSSAICKDETCNNRFSLSKEYYFSHLHLQGRHLQQHIPAQQGILLVPCTFAKTGGCPEVVA